MPFQVVDPASNFCYADMADMVHFSEIRMAQEWEELLRTLVFVSIQLNKGI